MICVRHADECERDFLSCLCMDFSGIYLNEG